jgi:BRO1-like domain
MPFSSVVVLIDIFIMLILPLKVSPRYDIRAVLSNWLDSNDNEDDAQHEQSFHTLYGGANTPSAAPSLFLPPKPSYSSQQCAMELKRLQSVRNCITDGILQANSHALALEEQALRDCYEYHAILLEFEKRGFPVTENTSSSDKNTLSITWKGAYSPVQKETHSTLVWERVCIIFNIVALLTFQVEHQCNTTDRDSCKTAVSYCQQGASLLSILRELCSSIASTSSSQNAFMTVDLSPSMLLFWEKLLIAEAQCYIYRMASLSPEAAESSDRESIGRQHRTLAVLCQAAFDLWNDALAASQDPRLASELPRQVTLWGTYLKASSMLYIGRAMYHQSVVYRVEDEHGNEIAQLRECQEKLHACAEFTQSIVNGSSKSEDGALSAASVIDYTARECQAILPVVRDRLVAADRTNLQLYHHVLPKTVPSIPAKQLAKLNPELPSQMVVPQIPLFTDM